MDFRKACELLRAAMYRSVDQITDEIIQTGEIPDEFSFKGILERCREEFRRDAKKRFGIEDELTEDDMYVGLVVNGRNDILMLMHRAEKGELVGKKIMVNAKSTSRQALKMIGEFFAKHHVKMEVNYDTAGCAKENME